MKRTVKMEKKARFPLLVVGLLLGTFVLGGAAGAMMYATGKAVLSAPRMQMVSHTEYRFGEAGQIITRLTDNQGNPILVTICNATILYPDKTNVVSNAGMTNSTIAGDFYYNFTTPNGPEGVYEYQATCYYPPNKNASVTNSFHLSSAFNTLQGNLTALNASLANITVSVNLTPVLDGLNTLNNTLQANFSLAFAYLNQINSTTNSTYTYLTTTLAAKVDSVLVDLGVINATVNRIELNTLEINTTTQQILTNQENAVQMQVFSG